MPDHLQVHVVSHTHWDREWYHEATRFRQRLVDLVDELLEDERLSASNPFLLDGQAIVLADYLTVRPDRREAVRAALGAGALEAGPWYVLADELIPSAESLVRNLLAGRQLVRALGGDPPSVLYSPDAFGHPAALPTLAAGFGMTLCIVWRGLGGWRWPHGDTFRWSAADGSEVLVHHLPPDGYEFGSSLPSDPAERRRWWRTRREVLAARASTNVVLLLNGADHHARQRDLEGRLDALAGLVHPDAIERSTLRRFARAITTAAERRAPPLIAGELRDSTGHAWSLQGTLGTRPMLKRANARAERLLLRDVEPWLALCALRGADGRRALLRAAWRTLLECHPHDTLCGCSIDPVARAMEARLLEVRAQGRGLREDALFTLLGHDREQARARTGAWTPLLVVRNRTAHARSGVAHIELLRFLRDVPVGPGSAQRRVRTAPAARVMIDPPLALQSLDVGIRHDRVESPRHYPDDDLVEAEQALVWVEGVRGYSTRTFALRDVQERIAGELPAHVVPASGAGHAIRNGVLRAAVDEQGVLTLWSLRGPEQVVVLLEDVGDAGDLYTHSPIGPSIRIDRCTRADLVETGPLRAALRVRYDLRLPESSTRRGRTRRRRRTTVELHASLSAAEPFLRIAVRGVNRARDHRLRLVLRTRLAGDHAHADAAFGTVRRDRAAPASAPEELLPSTAPLARHVTIRGDDGVVTLLSDGLAEYEATPTGELAVTLLRGVGELSREDLPERPGHAGWPAPTPLAQQLGPFAARLGVFIPAVDERGSAGAIERAAEDFLLPLVGQTLRSALAHYDLDGHIELEGDGLAFSCCKEREEGDGIVLRCVNLTDRPVPGAWHFASSVTRAWLARLDEAVDRELEPDGARLPFVAPPRGVVTIVVAGP